MRRPLVNRDPGDEHPEPLFDPATTVPPTCSCGTTRKNLCAWVAHRHFDGIDSKQPRTCLLRWDPATANFPEGY